MANPSTCGTPMISINVTALPTFPNTWLLLANDPAFSGGAQAPSAATRG
jgi:hypothetical protein